jgi:hypothetical protein
MGLEGLRKSRIANRRRSLALLQNLRSSLPRHRPGSQQRRPRLLSRRNALHHRQRPIQSQRRLLLRCRRGRTLRPLHSPHRMLSLRLDRDSRLQCAVDRSRRRRRLLKLNRDRYRRPDKANHPRVQFLQSHHPPLRCPRGHTLRLPPKLRRTLSLRLHKDSRLRFPAGRQHLRPLRKRARNRCRQPPKLGLCLHRRLVLRPTCRVPRSNAPACRHLRRNRLDRSRPQRQA